MDKYLDIEFINDKKEDITLNKNKLDKITNFLGKEEVMLQLSEECSELIQAILKYRRSNLKLIPKPVEDCYNNFIEELADVLLNISQLLYLSPEIKTEIQKIQDFKTNRWYDRLFSKGE